MDLPPPEEPIASLPPERGKARRLWLWWWLLLPATVFLVAHEIHSDRLRTAAAAADRAEVDMRNTDYRQAIVDFTESIRLGAEDVVGDRGLAHSKLGEYDQAIADYDEAIRLDPDASWLYYDRGLAHRNKGDYDRGIADFSEAIRLKPNNAKSVSRSWYRLPPQRRRRPSHCRLWRGHSDRPEKCRRISRPGHRSPPQGRR